MPAGQERAGWGVGGEVAFFVVDFFGILVGCLVFFLPFWLRVRPQDGALVPAVAGREKKNNNKANMQWFLPGTARLQGPRALATRWGREQPPGRSAAAEAGRAPPKGLLRPSPANSCTGATSGFRALKAGVPRVCSVPSGKAPQTLSWRCVASTRERCRF